MFIIANCHIRGSNEIFCFIHRIPHRTFAITNECDTVSFLYEFINWLYKIQYSIILVCSPKITYPVFVFA